MAPIRTSVLDVGWGWRGVKFQGFFPAEYEKTEIHNVWDAWSLDVQVVWSMMWCDVLFPSETDVVFFASSFYFQKWSIFHDAESSYAFPCNKAYADSSLWLDSLFAKLVAMTKNDWTHVWIGRYWKTKQKHEICLPKLVAASVAIQDNL